MNPRSGRLLAALIALCWLLPGCSGASGSQWTRHGFSDGSFSAVFPGQPYRLDVPLARPAPGMSEREKLAGLVESREAVGIVFKGVEGNRLVAYGAEEFAEHKNRFFYEPSPFVALEKIRFDEMSTSQEREDFRRSLVDVKALFHDFKTEQGRNWRRAQFETSVFFDRANPQANQWRQSISTYFQGDTLMVAVICGPFQEVDEKSFEKSLKVE